MIDSEAGTASRAPLEPGRITLRHVEYDHPDAALLVGALFEDQVERYGYADPAEADAGSYSPPHGLFVVAYMDGTPVACGGYRTYDSGSQTIEIKKMYALPALRGAGLGRLILLELERHAAVAGFRESILETGIRNTAALSLYTGAGYRPRARYATAYRDPEINRAFHKSLGLRG